MAKVWFTSGRGAVARQGALVALLIGLTACAAPPAQEPYLQVKASPEAAAFQEVGIASWYGPGFQDRPTASGEPFDMTAMTAAHKSLAFGTSVRVTNLANGRAVVVRINDRGPFVAGRIIDLSKRAAEQLGFTVQGVTKVRIEVLAAS